MGFSLVPKYFTVNYLEQRNRRYFALLHRNWQERAIVKGRSPFCMPVRPSV